MIGLLIIAVGWACATVGLVLGLGTWALVPIGAVTLTAGLLVDWEAVGAKRP